MTSDALRTNTQAEQGCNCHSVITKIFNPRKYWIVTIQPFFGRHSSIQWLYCLLLVFIVQLFFIQYLCLIRCFCLIQCFVRLFSVQIIQCILSSDTGNVFQVFWSGYTRTNQQSINIIQQTEPSLSSNRNKDAYYNYRHREISGTNFSIQVYQTMRQ